MKREPSCTVNHDAMRRELRDKALPSTPCPNCDWLLAPCRSESRVEVEPDIREIIRQELVSYGLIGGCAEDE